MERHHRIANPKAEHELMLKLWLKVQEKTGVRVGSDIKPDRRAYFSMDFLNLSIGDDFNDVQYAMGITDFATDAHLEAALTHELAHSLGKNEAEADIWAAQQGYGEASISWLRTVKETYLRVHGYLPPDDGIHPTFEQRMELIRKNSVDKSLSVGA